MFFHSQQMGICESVPSVISEKVPSVANRLAIFYCFPIFKNYSGGQLPCKESPACSAKSENDVAINTVIAFRLESGPFVNDMRADAVVVIRCRASLSSQDSVLRIVGTRNGRRGIV